MVTLTNSEDQDEMSHASISSGSAIFARTNISSEKEIQYMFEIIIFEP